MMHDVKIDEERGRITALRSYGVLDTPNEAQFDAIVREAARRFGVPIALVCLVDENRQWFKAKVGIEASETPLTVSFCTHAIRGNDVFDVPDASNDHRFWHNPLVMNPPSFRAYAGAPLKTPEGKRIGTLCVIDRKARAAFSEQDKTDLQTFAQRTMVAFERRKAANAPVNPYSARPRLSSAGLAITK